MLRVGGDPAACSIPLIHPFQQATTHLFTSLAAVLVGGTSLVGARGDYWRTVLGALILTLITTVLVGHGAGVATQQIIFGLLIHLFVALYGRDRRLRDRV